MRIDKEFVFCLVGLGLIPLLGYLFYLTSGIPNHSRV